MPPPLSNILVIGESNSVLKMGWLDGFAAVLGRSVQIDNRSIGSTGILNTLYTLARLGRQIQTYDAVIIDSAIQDVIFYLDDPVFYFSLMLKLQEYLEGWGVFFSVLYFEALDCNTREFQFKQQFFEICKVKNIHLFRMLDSIRNDAEQMIQGGIEKGYQDKYHLRPATAHRAGQEYARVLQAAYSARAPGNNGVESFIHAIDYQTFDKTGLDLSCGKISNRLVNFMTIQVDANGIQLPIPPDLEGHEMIGILFNATSSNGLLEMVGQDKLIKNVSSSSRKYWKNFSA